MSRSSRDTAPILAAHAAWAETGMTAYLRFAIPRQFHAWHWLAEDEAAVRDTRLPLLYLPNHSCWWDGFMGYLMAKRLEQPFFVMMQRDQLARYRMFSGLGAFSVDRDRPRQALEDLAYARTLLKPGHGVWVFPQGRMLAPSTRPLVLESGPARLAVAAGAVRCVPVALRYVFLSQPRPEAFIWLGTPWIVTPETPRAQVLREMAERLTVTLDRLDAHLAARGSEGFSPLAGRTP